jgi:hypothetical protein
VLWNAIVLRSRWGGWCAIGYHEPRHRGNIITSFSWFGVNMLGHRPAFLRFMDAAFKWLMLFMVSQGAVIALGMLPLQCWRSFVAWSPERGLRVGWPNSVAVKGLGLSRVASVLASQPSPG